MLQLNHVTKIYSSEKGVDVRALDDINLSFDQTGMVFLLGKSGSGKSTLLNLCGGLDKPTSGEIVIDGRSSSTFTDSDFDSYRNTYIGFIFQEYNILNEFTVEENVGIALELQGKSHDEETIRKTLRDVEIEDLAKRKPNTLSGGQKQRVAIARALVKNPKIIMADEPTGALDSETGKQVLDILKKLSKEKLVIVVSHDREFAETYGDRIIELKDGKVLTDTGCDSTPQPPRNATPTYEEGKFIKSRLPFKRAMRMGVNSMKCKPWRLVFTILLTTFSFVMFGLFSTLMIFDEPKIVKNTLKYSDDELIHLTKNYRYTGDTYRNGTFYMQTEGNNRTKIKKSEVDGLYERYGKDAILIREFTSGVSWNIFNTDNHFKRPIYTSEIQGFGFTHPDSTYRTSQKILWGHYPQSSDEVMISSFTFDAIKEAGYLLMYESEDSINSVSVEINDYEDLADAGLYLTYNNSDDKLFVRISGVYEVSISPAFNPLKEEIVGAYSQEIIDLLKLWDTDADAEFRYGFYSYLLVSDDFESFIETEFDDMFNLTSFSYCYPGITLRYSDSETLCDFTYFSSVPPDGQMNRTYDLDGNPTQINSLEEGEILIDFTSLAKIMQTQISDLLTEELKQEYRYSTDNPYQMSFQSILSKILLKEFSDVNYTIPQRIEAYKYFKQNFIDKNELIIVLNGLEITSRLPSVTIKGFFFGQNSAMYCSDTIYGFVENTRLQSNAQYTKEYTEYIKTDGKYTSMFVPKTSLTMENAIRDNYILSDDDSYYYIDNSFNHYLARYLSYIEITTTVFFFVGLGMAFFAVLLLFNMISTSVSSKKQEIGILRAVGARSKDIFNIFMAETFTIMAICIVLSVILTATVCTAFNSIVSSQLVIRLALFIYTPLSALITIAIAIVTALVSTTLPVYKIAKKCPADSIRTL